ncbi:MULTISPECIES: ABC transporter permease [Corynebacterium]|uniref:ABC transporter permease n=1 Tax=Corynebacterium TaxID=1716 RepID=UPI0026C33EDF
MARNAMRTVSLRTIAQHRLRLGLTVLAVILGTAFVSGSFMFSTSLSNTFDAAINNVYRGVDVGVGDGVEDKDGDGPPLDASMRDRLAQDSLVREVNVLSPQPVVIANEDAVAYQTQGDTSEVIAYYPPEQTVGEENALVQGHAPRGTGEVLVSESAVEDYGIGLGDRLMLVHPEHRDTVTVVGVSAPASQLGDDITISMSAPAFLDVYGDPAQLKLSAAEGTTAEDLAQHLSSTYDVEAETGEALADAAREEMAFALTAIRYLLIAFGLIALLVGTFIIANTFSMIVAQRTKEFALLRALGASQPQVVGSVVVESAIVGIFGSLVGVATGIGLVALIKAVMGTQGMPFEPGLGLSPAAIIVPLVLGVLVTTLSAYAPARRAGSVQPVEAMRGTDADAPASLRRRTIAGVVLAVVGIVAASAGAIIDASTTPPRHRRRYWCSVSDCWRVLGGPGTVFGGRPRSWQGRWCALRRDWFPRGDKYAP